MKKIGFLCVVWMAIFYPLDRYAQDERRTGETEKSTSQSVPDEAQRIYEEGKELQKKDLYSQAKEKC